MSTAFPFRIGQGYDCHALVEGRPLILGGVTIPHKKGLLGHSMPTRCCTPSPTRSSARAALGDIGRHFPDTDPQFKGADSRVLLREAGKRLAAAGYAVGATWMPPSSRRRPRWHRIFR
jgi:2-C-methyl-D-erythritol 2,4-cyclodiphosphate synthase